MVKQEEIRRGIAKIIAIRHFNGVISAVPLADTKEILEFLDSQGAVLEAEGKLPLISRERAESAVPLTDCSRRKYTPIEWEDNVRYVMYGAEIQRDKDLYDSGYVAVEPLIGGMQDG